MSTDLIALPAPQPLSIRAATIGFLASTMALTLGMVLLGHLV